MLISNFLGTHKFHIGEMAKKCEERFIVVSPFLASSPDEFLNDYDFSNIKTLEIVTTLKPDNKEQLTKPIQLREIINHFQCRYKNLRLKIHINNSLHGKLYFSLDGKSRCLVITSANFTKNGMEKNDEWGVSFTDENLISQALQEVFGCIDYEDVTRAQIERCCQFIDSYKAMNPDWFQRDPEIAGDSLKYNYADSDSANIDKKYFIKPVGHIGNPISLSDKHDFSDLHQNLHFSKKLPRGVRKGDVLITTAIGAGSIISWFSVISKEAAHATEQQIQADKDLARWPWYVEGRNQSQGFGKSWWAHNIQRQELVSEFIKNHPGTPITIAGGFSLGSLNYGGDKVQITEEFANFVIDKIKECETK